MKRPPRAKHFEVWAEHALALAVFRRTLTQWHRAGMAGERTGLRYSAARAVYDALDGTAADWPDTLDELQVMEIAALNVWAAAEA